MKFNHTADPIIKQHPRSHTYYFVRGKIQKSLQTQDFAQAVVRKKLLISDFEFSGEVAFTHTVGDLYPVYLEYKKKQSYGQIKKAKPISPKTLSEIEYIFDDHLLFFFKKTKLGKLTPGLWAKYCAQCSVSDLANHRKVLLGFLNWCVVKEYIKAVPTPLPLPFHVRRKRKIIKPEELNQVFAHAHGSLLLFLSLALFKGLRRTEIMTLTIAGVNTKERYLTIYKGFNKKRRERSIPINPIVADLLESRIQDIRSRGLKTPWIFPNARDPKRHGHLDGLKTAWNTVRENTGLTDITWHDFRATLEKHMNMSKDFSDVQKEKFADASMDVQKKIYVTMDHKDLKGLELSVNLPDLEKIIADKPKASGLVKVWK